MIPILFEATETDFNHNGLGKLTGILKYTVTEVLNSEFELYLEYPITGNRFTIIQDHMLILAKPNLSDDAHLFRIYEHRISTTEDRLEIYARSNTFDLAHNMVVSLTIDDEPLQTALDRLKNAAVETCDFTFVTDITTPSSTVWKRRSLLSCIGGEEGSIIQYWGGEIKRGNNWLWIYKDRGMDRDITIRHGRNLKGLTATYSVTGLITAIVPYSVLSNENGEEIVLMGDIVYSPRVGHYPHAIFQSVEYSVEDYGITVETLDEYGNPIYEKYMDIIILNGAAQTWFQENPAADIPSVNIEVEIEDISQTKEYELFKGLEKVLLGDTVHVFSEKFNVDISAKVIKVVYDGLMDKHTEIEIGRIKSTRYQEVKNAVSSIVEPISNKLWNVGIAASKKNKIFRGVTEPTTGMVSNDIWYKPVDDGETELYRFDGVIWRLERVSAGLLAGTIDAASGNLDVINLNADNITSGTIDASMIMLSSGYDVEYAIDNIETTPGPPGENAYSVIIESDNGYIFMNGEVETIMRARVFRGFEEITDTLDANQFFWTRKSQNSAGDLLWNDAHASGTKTITITSADVFQRATFFCEIHTI